MTTQASKWKSPYLKIVSFIFCLSLIAFCLPACNNLQEPPPKSETPNGKNEKTESSTATFTGEQSVSFCFWNVENLFDDKNDKRNTIDEPYDNAYAENQKLRQLKLDRIASALLKLENGTGPDVIACVELESVRSLELLQGALNAKITDPKQRYVSYAMRNVNGGRHIAPGVLSRYPLSQQRTRLLGGRSPLRILETHLFINNHDLCIVVSHWTSKLKQDDGGDGESGRRKYATTIYDAYKSLADKNPDIDYLLCGDFNDVPTAKTLTFDLGAIADIRKVKAGGEYPALFNLMAGKSAARFGTISYNNTPLIYDQICVSRGLLDDNGWSCEIDSIATHSDGLIRKGATRREPWRFSDPARDLKDEDRGYSDHFPVTVRLGVKPASTKQP